MGALPAQAPHLLLSNPHSPILPPRIDSTLGDDGTFGVSQLKLLFGEQQKFLDFFFTHLDYSQVHAFTHLCFQARGSIFFSGVGKSGFIAQKISQTLVSTGTKAAFLNPTDALHGDIGIVGPHDVVVLLSKSGAKRSYFAFVLCARGKGACLVGVSCLKSSKLRQICDMHVYLPLERELCPFDLAPVTSTTIQMLFWGHCCHRAHASKEHDERAVCTESSSWSNWKASHSEGASARDNPLPLSKLSSGVLV